MPTVHQSHRQTDGRTTYDSNTALAYVHCAVKTISVGQKNCEVRPVAQRRVPKPFVVESISGTK